MGIEPNHCKALALISGNVLELITSQLETDNDTSAAIQESVLLSFSKILDKYKTQHKTGSLKFKMFRIGYFSGNFWSFFQFVKDNQPLSLK